MKLLDTDTCIGLLKGDDAVVATWRSCGDQCALPSMVIGELYYGAFKSTVREEELNRVAMFVDIFPVIQPSKRSIVASTVPLGSVVLTELNISNV